MEAKWVIKRKLPATMETQPLRQLLEQTWLLPKRMVHFLRVREHVLVNGDYLPVNNDVSAGDLVELRFVGDEFRTPNSNYLSDASQPIEVLYEDTNLLVVNKPAGIKTHPNRSDESGTLMNLAAAYLARQGQEPFMVHRIDQFTSGAVVIAKNPVVVPILDRLISSKQIRRSYLAITAGEMVPKRGRIELPIGRDEDDRCKRRVDYAHGQSAITDYQVVADSDEHSLVKLELQTGRTHQIRVHLAAMGTPIVGDPLYNDNLAPQMLLHGWQLQLVLPFDLTKITIQAPKPPYFDENIVKWHLK